MHYECDFAQQLTELDLMHRFQPEQNEREFAQWVAELDIWGNMSTRAWTA